jgi:hypothetical protein
VTDQDQGREVAVVPLHLASARRDRQVLQDYSAGGSRSELAPYRELRAAVDQVAARDAWLARLDRGY